MKFLDVCAGIGGFRLGMEAAGHECVGFIEIDKFARKSYKFIHGLTKERKYSEWEWHNVKSLSNKSIRKMRRRIGKIDVICGGFPCQSFSIAGRRRGFEDTRGTIFFEIARIASILKPKYLLLENVRGLLNHGGVVPSKPLSAPWMNWGMMRRGRLLIAKSMSRKTGSEFSLSQILEEQVPNRFFLSEEKVSQLLKTV